MDVNSVIAKNFRSIRERKKLSLDSVAKLSGVSKSMLSQIEHGDVSPTITVLWKIANGLKISFTALVEQNMELIQVVRADEIAPIVESTGKYRSYPIFPFNDESRFEIYRIVVQSGGLLESEPHLTGTEEFITVHGGTVFITLRETDYELRVGDSIRFNADQSHRYENRGEIPAELSMVIFYGKAMM